MYAAIITLLAASSAIAAPVAQRDTPSHYSEGLLESYDTYHSRYTSIGCSGKQGTQFFTDCCHPLLSSQSVSADRPAYCASGYAASTAQGSSASAASSAVSAAVVVESSASPSAAAVASASASADVDDDASTTLDAAVAVAQPTTKSKSHSASASPSSEAAWTEASSSASPSPTASSAAAAQSSSASSGTYTETGGYATFFYQGGNPGACGIVHSDSELGIAIDGNGWWQNYGVTSEHCGKYINIRNTNNGKTVTAQVWDVCPTCVNDNSLDLSVGAFQAIASESDGMVPIEWSFA